MSEKYTRGEMHDCIVCSKPHHLYVEYDSNDRFVDCKVMSAGGIRVQNAERPLAACQEHDEAEIRAALAGTTYRPQKGDDD